jgi:predicted alpha/beta-hydrolase family hydrolase
VKRWILAGHSNGARVAIALSTEMLEEWRVDNSQDIPLGLILFSFPLHPPGKFDDLRDDELMSIELPTFIVRGTRDTFSRQDLFDSVIRRMHDAKKACPVIVHDAMAGNHSLQVPKSSKDTTTDVELDGVRTALVNYCVSLQNLNVAGRVLHEEPAGRGANGSTKQTRKKK